MSIRKYPKKSDLEIEFKKIAKKQKRSIADVKREYFKIMAKNIVSDYLETDKRANEFQSLTNAQIKRKFMTIKKTAEKLKECINEFSGSNILLYINRDIDIEFLDGILSRVNMSIDFFSTPSKVGNKEDIALNIFINDMAWLWEVMTGKKPGVTYDHYHPNFKGWFTAIVYSSLIRVGKKPWSKDALAKRIQRELKK